MLACTPHPKSEAEADVIIAHALSFFARVQKSILVHSQKARADGGRVARRREPTTFQKCLAVHLYYAAPQAGQN
jgi:hypothetical protein